MLHDGSPPENVSAEVTAICTGRPQADAPADVQPKDNEAGSSHRVTHDSAEVTAICTGGPQADTPADVQPKAVDETASSTEVTGIDTGAMPVDGQPSSPGVLACRT